MPADRDVMRWAKVLPRRPLWPSLAWQSPSRYAFVAIACPMPPNCYGSFINQTFHSGPGVARTRLW